MLSLSSSNNAFNASFLWKVLLLNQALTNQILNDYLHILMLYIICSLTYFHIKIFAHVKEKHLTCIPYEHQPFWQLSRLDDLAINATAKHLVYGRLKMPEAYSEPSQTSKIDLFAKVVNS